MVITIKKVVNELKIKSPDLITRPLGRKFYEAVAKELENIHDNETVVINFEEIQVIDSSFIDEFLIKLIRLSRKESPKFYIKLQNISDITEINIDLVFSSFSNYNNDRVAVITEEICQNNRHYLGQLSELEKDIIDYLRINKISTITDLGKFTDLAQEEIQDIMKVLHELRIVKKDDGAYVAI